MSVNWKFWKKEKGNYVGIVIDVGHPKIAIEPIFDNSIEKEGCINEEEEKLNKQWALAKSNLNHLEARNVANLSPIESAKQHMNVMVAWEVYKKIDAEMREYVRKTYG